MFEWLTAGGALLSGAGSIYGAIQGGPEGISWGDINKNLAYQKALLKFRRGYDKRIRKDLRADQHKLRLQDATKFSKYAQRMGVSRHALLGQPQGGVSAMPVGAAPPSTSSRSGRSSTGAAMQQMGQSIMRGVQITEALKTAQSSRRLDDAQAKLYEAQAEAIVNQNQRPPGGITEENIWPGEVTAKYYEGMKSRGGATEDRPTLTKNNIIRHYPSQEIQDYISESMPAEALYIKGKFDYAGAMNRAHDLSKDRTQANNPLVKAYYKERNYLEYVFNRQVEWVPHWKAKKWWHGAKGSSAGGYWIRTNKNLNWKRYR